MKIIFTGGGSGGHFYPLMAIAESVQTEIKEQKVLDSKLYYIADTPYDEEALFVNGLEFIKLPTGKLRVYASIENLIDIWKTALAVIKGFFIVFNIYPDVVVSKGGYPAFPVVIAAWLLRIPVVMHESDMAPGRVNAITARFAKRIAVSFADAIPTLGKPSITAWTGQPIRNELWAIEEKNVIRDFLGIKDNAPIIVIYGGSQGAGIINDGILSILPNLVQRFHVVHQVGVAHEESVRQQASYILKEDPFSKRYHLLGFFNPLMLRMLAGGADMFITRGGAGSIFDMAMWHMPAIIIPITHSNKDHQRKNAYAYARTGGAIVLEEKNLKAPLLLAEIERLMGDESLREEMKIAGSSFIKKDAASVIAKEVVALALSHESE